MKHKAYKIFGVLLATVILIGLAACRDEPFVYSSTNEAGTFENNFFTISYDESVLSLSESQPEEGETTALVSLTGKENTPRVDILNVNLAGITKDTSEEEISSLVMPIIQAYYSEDIREKITFKKPTISIIEDENGLVFDMTIVAEEYKAAYLPEVTFDIKIKGAKSGVVILFIHKNITDEVATPYRNAIDSVIVK